MQEIVKAIMREIQEKISPDKMSADDALEVLGLLRDEIDAEIGALEESAH